MNILLVDDTKSNIKLLKFHVEDWFDDNDIDNVILDVAYDGKEALEKTTHNGYDIIFLDIMMPIMDGLEALSLIRNTALEKQPIIIMQTALDKTKTKHDAHEFGADAYITKPINQTEVYTMLNRYVDESLDDDFMDFDDFDDFDDFVSDEMNDQKNMMEHFNASHKKVPASQFLKNYPDLTDILIKIDSLEEL